MMQTLEKDFPVRIICQMLGVSKTAGLPQPTTAFVVEGAIR